MADDIDQLSDRIIEGALGPSSEPAQEPAPAAEPSTPAPAAAPAAVPGTPAEIEYPKSWKQDYKTHWPKIPREVQEYVTKVREKDYLDGLEQYKAGHTYAETLRGIINPYLPRIQSLNLQPEQAIQYLLNAEYTLAHGTTEQKVAALKNLIRDYGIDPATLIPNPNAPQPSAAEAALLKRISGLEGSVTSFMSQQQQEHQGRVLKEVSAFAADPKNVYFEELGDDIAMLLKANRNLSLPEAYERAMWGNPSVRAKEQTRIQKETEELQRKEKEAAAAKAKNARAASTRGKPSAKEAAQPLGSIDDTLRETLTEINSRT